MIVLVNTVANATAIQPATGRTTDILQVFTPMQVTVTPTLARCGGAAISANLSLAWVALCIWS